MRGGVRSKSSRTGTAITALVFFVLYLPLITVAAYSVLLPGGGMGLDLYRRALANADVMRGLELSLFVGGASTAISTVIGTGAALALSRSRLRFSRTFRRILETVTFVPLVMPEIVLGISLLAWFVFLGLTLGTFSITLAHVTFSVSYVIVTVSTRLQGMDGALEEAAFDLGATRWQAFWRVTFPLIRPAVLSGALLAFTLSFDDFLVAFFTSAPGSETLPLRIYSMIKFGMNPELHAVSTLILLLTLVAVVVVFRPFSLSGPARKQ